MTWDLNEISPPESEALQAEREIVEALVSNLHDDGYDEAVAQANLPVSFKRLRNRAWGVTGPSALVREGESVTVTKRDGSTTTVTVGRVLWSDESKAIATISK